MIQAQQQADIAVHIHPLAIDGQQRVANLQAGFGLEGTAIGKSGDGGVIKGLRIAVQHQQDHKTRHKVHKRTGGKNQQSGPEPLVVQGVGIIRILILALHGAKAAAGDGAERIQCIALLLFPQGGPHADGKFIDGHAAGFGRQKVTQFMDGDQYTKDEDRHKNIDNG